MPPARRSPAKRRPRRPAQQATRLAGVSAGRYAPLLPDEVERIHDAAIDILATTGLSEATDHLAETVCAAGGAMFSQGRLTFPAQLVQQALAGLRRDITLHGQRPGLEIELTGTRVHTGTGGAAPNIIDLETGAYRPSTLRDLYDAARLVNTLDHVHFFSRSLVAGDMADDLALDINTAFASLAGTAKHVCTSISAARNVAPVAALCHAIAGTPQAFRDRPFLSVNVNHVVPPLRFSPEACDVLAAAVHAGLPVMVNTFGQLGASSPVTIAGSLAQTIAETLAGAVYAWLIDPSARIIFGPRPMVTDLRTGAMSGGGGEQALLTAAAVQMCRHYGLPNSTIAGASDAKLADVQSGYEKSLAVTLAAQAGCNMITQACGMQAGLLGVSLESYVIDNDMLGAILRTLAPVDLSASALSTEAIRGIVLGEGHFLGDPETYKRMQSDFLYPEIADRRTPDEWQDAGRPDISSTARDRVRQVLATHFPTHIPAAVIKRIRAGHDIQLPPEHMTAN